MVLNAKLLLLIVTLIKFSRMSSLMSYHLNYVTNIITLNIREVGFKIASLKCSFTCLKWSRAKKTIFTFSTILGTSN